MLCPVFLVEIWFNNLWRVLVHYFCILLRIELSYISFFWLISKPKCMWIYICAGKLKCGFVQKLLRRGSLSVFGNSYPLAVCSLIKSRHLYSSFITFKADNKWTVKKKKSWFWNAKTEWQINSIPVYEKVNKNRDLRWLRCWQVLRCRQICRQFSSISCKV